MQKVAVFGMGYVGCVTAACLSRDGHRVIGVEVDPAKIAEINAGVPPITEPGLAPILEEQVRNGSLRAMDDVREAVACSEIALVSVGTPSDDNGAVTSLAVEAVVKSIGRSIRGLGHQPYVVVVRSTLLPGILEERLAPLLAESAGRNSGTICGCATTPSSFGRVRRFATTTTRHSSSWGPMSPIRLKSSSISMTPSTRSRS